MEQNQNRTLAMTPVGVYRLIVDLDSMNSANTRRDIILKVARRCMQAWLLEVRRPELGGCGGLWLPGFRSFGVVPGREGGSVLGGNDVIDQCTSFHDCGRPVGSVKTSVKSNYRMTRRRRLSSFTVQRFQNDNNIRLSNALYLDKNLKKIPGIVPTKLAEGGTRSAYHLYSFRYLKEKFNNIPKEKFLEALRAEGIPGNSGYRAQNKDEFIEQVLASKGYKRLYSEARLKQWRKKINYPVMTSFAMKQ